MAESSPSTSNHPQPIPLRVQPVEDAHDFALRTTVPTPLGTLIGRDDEVAALASLATRDEVRLLTVTGPGGVGKTRLVLGVAHQAPLAEAFGERVTFVSLASIAEPSQVLIALARAFGVSEKGEPGTGDSQPISQRLANVLSGEQRLLIIDNVEHVAAAGSSITELAGMCPNLTIVMTSRIRLRLGGEYEFPVSPLPVPETASDLTSLTENPSVALFVARASAASPGFVLNDTNASTIAQVCQKLDGLPLAIELAAARSSVLTPHAILTRLNSRLHLLSDGPTDAPTRLRSMRDAVAWSLDLLLEDAIRLFCRLSIVPGPITEAIAEAMAAEIPVVPTLTALIEASLVQRLPGDEARWQMLETVREVGHERLEAAGDVNEAYLLLAGWLRRLIDQAAPDVIAGKQDLWFPLLDDQQDAFRAVITWANRVGRPEIALGLIVGPLWFYWSMRGWTYREHEHLELAMATAAARNPNPVDPSLWVRSLFTAGLYQMIDRGNYRRARANFLEALQLYDDLPTPSGAHSSILLNLGVIEADHGDFASARHYLDEALAIRREAGEPSQIARVLVNLGNVANFQGDFAAATRYLDEALVLLRQTGERRTIGHCLQNLGETAALQGRTADALIAFDQALGVLRQTADLPGECIALIALAITALARRDVARAVGALTEALTYLQETRLPAHIADALTVVAEVAVAVDQPSLTPRFLTVATAIRTATETIPAPIFQSSIERTRAAAIATLGAIAYDEGVIAARPLTTEDALAEATAFIERLDPLHLEQRGPHRSSASRSISAIPLTARQLEVLRLLGTGLTDPEIGEELGISTRTVETHVSSILNKLHVHARTAAVAYAVRHGLI